jgi:exodeoxyribonuclease III
MSTSTRKANQTHMQAKRTRKILCWNVNGIRAVWKKDFLGIIEREDPDVICLQESKIQAHQLTQEMRDLRSMLNPMGYFSEWAHAERAGYSGVVTFSKEKPRQVVRELSGVSESMGKRFDDEGRLIITEFFPEGRPQDGFTLVNVYIPNGGRGPDLVKFKLDYYDAMLDMLEKLRREGHNLVICGDFNTAHHPIDLARPRENENVTGFLPVERAWLDKFEAAGYVDTFRHFNPEEAGAYTWWSYRSAARERNVGWRIDYFFVNEEFLPQVKSSRIRSDIFGSDHCPLELVIEV